MPGMDHLSTVIKEFRTAEDMLVKKSHYLETKLVKQRELTKNYYRENKRVDALRCFKRVKRYERWLSQCQRTLDRLQSLCHTLEKSVDNQQFLHALYSARASTHNYGTAASAGPVLCSQISGQHNTLILPAPIEESEVITVARGILQNLNEADVEEAEGFAFNQLQRSSTGGDGKLLVATESSLEMSGLLSPAFDESPDPSVPIELRPQARKNDGLNDNEIRELEVWACS